MTDAALAAALGELVVRAARLAERVGEDWPDRLGREWGERLVALRGELARGADLAAGLVAPRTAAEPAPLVVGVRLGGTGGARADDRRGPRIAELNPGPG